MQKHIRDCADALKKDGFEIAEIDENHKHPRIYLRMEGVERFIILSSSPQSAADEVNHAVQRARRAFGIKRGKVVNARRQKRQRKAEPVMEPPEPVAAPRHDYHDDLTHHEHYPAVLEMRLQSAFAGLWRDVCMDLFGAPSVVEAHQGKKRLRLSEMHRDLETIIARGEKRLLDSALQPSPDGKSIRWRGPVQFKATA